MHMKFIIIGLSISSSWGNGHATTYRALLKELAKMGHDILFLERDVPYYASHRDMPAPEFCRLGLYQSNEALKKDYKTEVENADVVIVGSYVKNGVEVGNWVTQIAKGLTAFYDIDTPVTMAMLEREDFTYITPELIAKYNLYLSFSGGPVLDYLENNYHSAAARTLYCSVDPEIYYPEKQEGQCELGYLGTYSIDRQPTLNELLIKTAAEFPDKEFVVAGPQYPANINWPENVERIDHLPPSLHRDFYNQQRFALNVTRQDMIKAGFSPSVRLFEAAACGVPVISDYWEGIETVFEPDTEILIAETTEDVQRYLKGIDEKARKQIGERARQKILQFHTAKARAYELMGVVLEAMEIKEKYIEKNVMSNI